MSFLQKLINLIQSLFQSSSPESQQRQVVKKIEAELRNIAPNLYKNGLIQVNFAETLRVLFDNTKVISDILADSFCSTNLDTQRRYEEQLLLTGFDKEAHEVLESFASPDRKKEAMQAQTLSRFFEAEHRKLEKVVKQLNSIEFIKIDLTFDKLHQLYDICRFNYMTALKLFDPAFSTNLNYEPVFQGVPIDLMENSLLDLYYVIVDMDITNSTFNALLALYKLQNAGFVTDEKAEELKKSCKKIQSIVKHIFTKETLMLMLRIAKKNAEFVPDKATYKGNSRQKYADYLESRFRVDENRLKSEIQDEAINSEINQIFGQIQLMSVVGYSKDLDNQLKQSTACSFTWTLPMQILKNFVQIFYENHVKPLLNDIVIEGFFNNAAYKSEFSAMVFACNESIERITAFEKKFARNAPFDEANIISLIRDSHKDPAFEQTLKDTVDKINRTAKELIQTETTNIFQLYKTINDILVETKKPSSEIITNLKVLMISSRNRENSEFMENTNQQWKIFLEIMKNYVIIGNIEKNPK